MVFAPRSKTSMMIMRPAAAWTTRLAEIVSGTCRPVFFRFCNGEQLTRVGNVVGASALGEQPVVADAVQAAWQHVDEEAGGMNSKGPERHLAVSIATFDAVVLPLEGDASLVAGDKAAVGDGHTVGV